MGVLGLAKDKKAILVLASGGVYTEGPWRPWDFVEPYLRQILGFIGIVDVQTVRVEGMKYCPARAADAVAEGEKGCRGTCFLKNCPLPDRLYRVSS